MTSRRSFVDVLFGGSLGATMLSVVYPLVEFLIPPAVSESQENSVTAATVNELKPNSGKIFRFGNQPGILVRTANGDFRAFTAVCPHLNCTVQYRDDMQHIWCACHGGVFDLNGINVSGPPPRPLEQFEVNLSGEEVLVRKG